ncbi:MAG: NHL repeat-containing protein, partial [Anaerolineae bacterium]|nr:NHL repeat-containing protein [Anaerolineae bacterium]
VAAQIWDMGVGAEVISEFETSLAELWTPRAADLIIGGQQGSLLGQLDHPRDVAVSDDGLIYVTDSLNHRIQVFDEQGNLVNAWGTMEVGEHGEATGGNFNQPWGLDIGPDGNIYVADTWNHRIQVFTPDGEFIRAWGQLGQLQEGEAPVDFWGPREVLVDDEGLVYVADTGNKRIRVYTAEGELVREIGIGGAGAGQLNEPVGLAMSPDGRLFVADTWNRRIQVFDRSGQFLLSWNVNGWYGDRGNRPYLALDAERGLLYVSDPEAARVLVYDFSGVLLGSFGELGPEEGTLTITQFRVPGGLDVDAGGNLWVADAEGERIMRFPSWDELAIVLPPADDASSDSSDTGLDIQDAGAGADDAPSLDPLDAPPPTEEVGEPGADSAPAESGMTEETTEEVTPDVTEEVTEDVTEDLTEGVPDEVIEASPTPNG